MKTNITEVINKLEEMYNDNIVLAKNIKSMAKELETIENDATPATVNGVTIDYTTFSKLINLLSMLKDIPEAMDMYNKLTIIGICMQMIFTKIFITQRRRIIMTGMVIYI